MRHWLHSVRRPRRLQRPHRRPQRPLRRRPRPKKRCARPASRERRTRLRRRPHHARQCRRRPRAEALGRAQRVVRADVLRQPAHDAQFTQPAPPLRPADIGHRRPITPVRTPRRRRWRRRAGRGAVHVGAERGEQCAELRARSAAATCARARRGGGVCRSLEMRKVCSPTSVRIPFTNRDWSHKKAHSRGAQAVVSKTRAGVTSQAAVGMGDAWKARAGTRQAAATLRPPLFLQPLSPSAPRPRGRANMSVLDWWATAAGGRTLAGLWRLCGLVVRGAVLGRAGVVYSADQRRQTTRPQCPSPGPDHMIRFGSKDPVSEYRVSGTSCHQ